MMRMSGRPSVAVLAAIGGLTLVAGCVERTAKVRTNPPGAIVVMNDEEVGVSPVKFNFLWYGDYDIMIRKPGYETLKTHHRIDAPWWQYPPFDIVAETLIPTTIRDEHELPVYELTPLASPAADELVERAQELRERAYYEGP